MPPAGDEGWVGGSLVAELGQHRVAGDGIGDEEDRERRQQRHADDGGQARCHEAQHRRSPFPGGLSGAPIRSL